MSKPPTLTTVPTTPTDAPSPIVSAMLLALGELPAKADYRTVTATWAQAEGQLHTVTLTVQTTEQDQEPE